MFFQIKFSGKPDAVSKRLVKRIAGETEVDPDTIEAHWKQIRDTLSFMKTFVAPLNDEPSHIYEFRVPGSENGINIEVFVDGDRGTPLGIGLRGATAFTPSEPLSYRPGAIGGRFDSGSEADIAAVRAGGRRRLLRRAVNRAYSNIVNPGTHLRIDPLPQGGARVEALRMPATRWLFFDHLGVRDFKRLLDALDSLAD